MSSTVLPISAAAASRVAVAEHYMHRAPQVSYAFGLFVDDVLRGVVTYGVPASRDLQRGVCPSDPDLVLELNRLWVDDSEPRNTESSFVARSLRMLPPRIVVSYADPVHGHRGHVYRALSFRYAGWTDMDRKTPRLDYIPHDPLRHSREATRSGTSAKVRRTPKIRYWTVSGPPLARKFLARKCAWPTLDWHHQPPPTIEGSSLPRNQPPARQSATTLLF